MCPAGSSRTLQERATKIGTKLTQEVLRLFQKETPRLRKQTTAIQ